MTNTALITGASAGLGKEFARYHASKGGNLVLTARRKKELDALKKEIESKHSITVYVIALDLGKAGGAEKLIKEAEKTGEKISILINNAGFGGHGMHTERDIAEDQAMIDLNVKALVTLTHHFGGKMAANGGGKILNVGSTAGFMPGPLQAVYFATKAFVNSYSQAIDQELRSKGVTCSVLAPGYVETEFAQVANLEGTDMVKSGKQADEVARIGYDAMIDGKLVKINEMPLSFLLNWITPLLPRRVVLKMVENMQSK